MLESSKPIANPLVVLREEFDDWAVLFEPDTGEGYGLNPMSVFVWKHLDGRHTVHNILTDLRSKDCKNMPEDAERRVQAFIDDLVEHGLAGHELQEE